MGTRSAVRLTAAWLYLKQVFVKHRIYQLFEGKAYSLVRDENDFVAAKRFLLVVEN